MGTFVEYMTGKTELPASFLGEVEALIASIGAARVAMTEADYWLLGFSVKQTESEIQTNCNLYEVPEGLYPHAVRMVVAEYLITKKGMGQLQGLETLTFDQVVKQIREGDTSVDFAATMTPEARFDAVMVKWISEARKQFVSFRRLKW